MTELDDKLDAILALDEQRKRVVQETFELGYEGDDLAARYGAALWDNPSQVAPCEAELNQLELARKRNKARYRELSRRIRIVRAELAPLVMAELKNKRQAARGFLNELRAEMALQRATTGPGMEAEVQARLDARSRNRGLP